MLPPYDSVQKTSKICGQTSSLVFEVGRACEGRSSKSSMDQVSYSKNTEINDSDSKICDTKVDDMSNFVEAENVVSNADNIILDLTEHTTRKRIPMTDNLSHLLSRISSHDSNQQVDARQISYVRLDNWSQPESADRIIHSRIKVSDSGSQNRVQTQVKMIRGRSTKSKTPIRSTKKIKGQKSM